MIFKSSDSKLLYVIFEILNVRIIVFVIQFEAVQLIPYKDPGHYLVILLSDLAPTENTFANTSDRCLLEGVNYRLSGTLALVL